MTRLPKFTFLISFKNGETRTVTVHDTDQESAIDLVWSMLPGKDQIRLPRIQPLTNSEVCE